MCEQCQAFDDEDQDALAAAFVARQRQSSVKAGPLSGTTVYRKASAAVPPKEKPNA